MMIVISFFFTVRAVQAALYETKYTPFINCLQNINSLFKTFRNICGIMYMLK